MARDIAFDLAEHAANLKIENMSASAIEATKFNIYDTFSCGYAGSEAIGVQDLIALAESWGGAEQATIYGAGKKFPAHTTAMINAVQCHGFDWDDNHDTAMLHSGSVCVAAAMAAAELSGGVSGADLLAGIAAGLDIHCRLGLAATIGIVSSGFIYTSLMGGFGAAAAAGRVMGLDADQMRNAFGIVLSTCAGTYQAITDSAQTKAMQAGFAAEAGVRACELAKMGVIGCENVFEGKYGLYHIYLHDEYDPEPLKKDLGTYFAQEGMGYKPWPCGRPNHPAINVCLEVREEYHPDPDEIERVELRLNEHLVSSMCTPLEVRQNPQNVIEGRFSIPYTAACALVKGKVGLKDFTEEGIADPEVRKMAKKIFGVVDEEIEKGFHGKVCPAVAVITMKDGSVITHRMEHTMGSPERPMSEAVIEAKIRDCMDMSRYSYPEDRPARLKEAVYNMEKIADSYEFMKLMLP